MHDLIAILSCIFLDAFECDNCGACTPRIYTFQSILKLQASHKNRLFHRDL